MGSLMSYVSKQQVYFLVIVFSIVCMLAGWSRGLGHDVANSKFGVLDLNRELPASFDIDVDLTSLSNWNLATEKPLLKPQLTGGKTSQSVENIFEGPPPIFAVIESKKTLSVYVKDDAGFKKLNQDDKFKKLTLRNISMSSLTFETETGEMVTVTLFDSANL